MNMKKERVTLSKIALAGIEVRTNNEDEQNPRKAKIAAFWDFYMKEGIEKKLRGVIEPDLVYGVYYDYETDEKGSYSFFIGKEVDQVKQDGRDDLKLLTIEEGAYQKIKLGPGKMPDLVIGGWQKVWSSSKETLGGERRFVADFELYNKKNYLKNATTLELYIGVK